ADTIVMAMRGRCVTGEPGGFDGCGDRGSDRVYAEADSRELAVDALARVGLIIEPLADSVRVRLRAVDGESGARSSYTARQGDGFAAPPEPGVYYATVEAIWIGTAPAEAAVRRATWLARVRVR